MPTLEDEVTKIEPNEVEIACGQAEVERYWALVTTLVALGVRVVMVVW